MSMTGQEVYNQVVDHLRQQGCKAVDDNVCQYRTHDGKKCAAGCLVKDEEYTLVTEGLGAIHLFDDIASFKERVGRKNLELLMELQRCHDHKAVDEWEHQFKRIAELYDLTYSPPKGRFDDNTPILYEE